MRALSFLLSFVIASGIAYSQDLNFPGTAPSVSLTLHFRKIDLNFLSANKFRIGDHRVREVDYKQEWLEIYSQALASKRLNEHWQLAMGYGFQRNNPLKHNWRNEHRLVQQVSYIISGGFFKFYNRFRFEERWFSYPSQPSAFGTRARYQAAIMKALNDKKFYWQLSDEVYSILSGPRFSFISENWLYTGIGFPARSLGQFETGIGYNSISRNMEKELMSLILLQVNWIFIIPPKMKMKMDPMMHSRQF